MTHQTEIAKLFEQQFNSAPSVISFAPGRINLMGEHTDYNDGLVLPIPLPIGITVAIGKANKPGVFAFSDLYKEVSFRNKNESANQEWTDYLLAAISVFPAPLPQGINIAVLSTLPHGASVSSSAALLVAVLRGLRDLSNAKITDDQIARLAQKGENEFVGVQCGLMDQMVSSRGIENAAMLFDTQSGDIQNVGLIRGTSLVTLHSGQTRKLQGNPYNDRRQSCYRAAKDMGFETLREASIDDLARVRDEDDRRKAHHVISDNQRVWDAVKAISNDDTKTLGQLINQCHKSLRDDFDVSTPAMDDMVSFCQENGALGARMTGAGFGGCIIMLAQSQDAETLSAKVLQEFPKAWHVNTMSF